MKPDWQNCAILEPSSLLDRIAQFLEERLVSLQNCAIVAAQPATRRSLEKQLVRGMHQALLDRLPFCKKNIEYYVLEEARHGVVKGW